MSEVAGRFPKINIVRHDLDVDAAAAAARSALAGDILRERIKRRPLTGISAQRLQEVGPTANIFMPHGVSQPQLSTSYSATLNGDAAVGTRREA